MKPSRFTEEQIIGILREQEGHVACTLRSVHHGHPRQYTGLYTTVCNHDLYTMACTQDLYT